MEKANGEIMKTNNSPLASQNPILRYLYDSWIQTCGVGWTPSQVKEFCCVHRNGGRERDEKSYRIYLRYMVAQHEL